ncbi:transporter [Massilia sp. TN1-12]|uniref:transporter n=1 Tax=Massilia paldalensis TaxID=3377675 RepID=UPI003850D047
MTLYRACMGAALLLAANAAHADPGDDAISPDRPGFANAPDVVGKGRIQLETSVQWDRERHDDEHERTISTPTLLRFGVSDKVELRLETDGRDIVHDVDPASGERTTTVGYADTALGIKWHLADQQGARPSLALLGEVELPSGSRDLRGRGARPAVYLPAGWDFDRGWSVQFEPGVAMENDERGARYRYGFLALTLAKELSARWQGYVEVAAPQIASSEHGGTQAAVDGGFMLKVSKDCQLDLSVVHGLNHRTPDLSLAFGVSIRR